MIRKPAEILMVDGVIMQPRSGIGDTAGMDVEALRAVLCVSQAMLSAQHFEDALAVVAEQSLVAVGAASLSISRWERRRGVLRTLINVGELGPGEQRWPQDEECPLAGYRYVTICCGRVGPTSAPSTTTTRIPPAFRFFAGWKRKVSWRCR